MRRRLVQSFGFTGLMVMALLAAAGIYAFSTHMLTRQRGTVERWVGCENGSTYSKHLPWHGIVYSDYREHPSIDYCTDCQGRLQLVHWDDSGACNRFLLSKNSTQISTESGQEAILFRSPIWQAFITQAQRVRQAHAASRKWYSKDVFDIDPTVP